MFCSFIIIVSQVCWASQSLKWEGWEQETELFLLDKLKIHLILRLSVDIRNLWECIWCWQCRLITQSKCQQYESVRSDNHCTLCQAIIKHIFSNGRPFCTSVTKKQSYVKNYQLWSNLVLTVHGYLLTGQQLDWMRLGMNLQNEQQAIWPKLYS